MILTQFFLFINFDNVSSSLFPPDLLEIPGVVVDPVVDDVFLTEKSCTSFCISNGKFFCVFFGMLKEKQ